MKVVIVNCFDTYEDRVLLLRDYFEKRGDAVRVVTSDFCHFKKEYRTEKPKGFIFIHAKRYDKNLSADRVISHDRFAREAFEAVKRLKPDLLWVLAPPNSLVRQAAHYRKKNAGLKLIIDLIDMWPETMPMGQIKALPPFAIWRNLRDGYVDAADMIVTECALYKRALKGKCDPRKIKTLYLAKRFANDEATERRETQNIGDETRGFRPESGSKSGRGTEVIVPPSDRVVLCYLGSINNIIDIDCISEIIRNLPSREKKPLLHIIGDGEQKESLVSAAIKAGAEVNYHGKVYDEDEKQEIFDECHFGLNIMKSDVFVGLTMKSLDYFAAGLPIINNIPADTARFVEKYGIGINIDSKDAPDKRKSDLTLVVNGDNKKMRESVKRLFNEKFTVDSFERKAEVILMKAFSEES